VTGPSLAVVGIETDVAAALARVPEGPGVGQVLGPEGKNLLVGRGAGLRKWFATRLGRGRPPRPGARPPLDLTPIATALAFAETTSDFHQRLTYERLMARYVPLPARRDLKPPAFVHLDPEERFPRARATGPAAVGPSHFGPFRDRRAAARAVEALHARFPLRPCEFDFEPAADLPLGLSCLYAQVRSCAAPCLVRVSEDAYRSLAAEAAGFLADPARRGEETRRAVPGFVARATARAVVAAKGSHGLELYAAQAGRVADDPAVVASTDDLAAALSDLRWPAPEEAGQDWPWLVAWLQAPRRKGAYLVWPEHEPARSVAARVAAVIT
jgi:hypothetical protein